jgi:hypothetical protein
MMDSKLKLRIGLAASRVTISGNYTLRRSKHSKNEVVVPKEEEKEEEEKEDDGLYICPKRVEFFTKINLRNSASCWILL